MKKYYIIMVLCLASAAGFSQTQNENAQSNANNNIVQNNHIREIAKDPKTAENAAKADVTLINKKEVTKEKRKKKPRREKTHKECSRMKS